MINKLLANFGTKIGRYRGNEAKRKSLKYFSRLKMKKLWCRLILVLSLSVLFQLDEPNPCCAQEMAISYKTFYEELAPYGQWISDAQYGSVWVPRENKNFRPYFSRGSWVITDYGNTWISDDPWGWACYHYGRWTYDTYYRWIWIPGYEWAPAWVSWRMGGGYCGWAPMAPGTAVAANYNTPESWWVFMEPKYMYLEDCAKYWHGAYFNHVLVNRTAAINNFYVDHATRVHYNFGPGSDLLEQVTHQAIPVYRVSQSKWPGASNIGKNGVSIFRPVVVRSPEQPDELIPAPKPIGGPKPIPERKKGKPSIKTVLAKMPLVGHPVHDSGHFKVRRQERD